MKILAIDAASSTMAVAIVEDKKILGSLIINGLKNHSVTLMPAIETMMQQVKLQPSDLDRIAVSQGPGSYTGLRIGVTLAKTLAWTLQKELVGVSSLAVIAGNIKSDERLLVPVIDARRHNVYTGVYQWQAGQLVTVMPDRHVALSDWLVELKKLPQPLEFVGETEKFAAEIEAAGFTSNTFPELDLPSGVVLAQLARDMAPTEDISAFVPHYLKLVEAEEKWQLTHPGAHDENYVEKI